MILARLLKSWSRKVQLHSIIHCVTATLWSSYLLRFYEPSVDLLNNVITHSGGYFIADIIDILIDNNIKRRIYILHHVAAISGILTVYFNSYYSIYAIWTLEIGGIVHHLKYAADVNKVNIILYWLAHIFYHVIYLISRSVLGVIIVIKLPEISNIGDAICIFVGVVLLIQNFSWWFHNIKKTFGIN